MITKPATTWYQVNCIPFWHVCRIHTACIQRLGKSLHLRMTHLRREIEKNLSASPSLWKLKDLPRGPLTFPPFKMRAHEFWVNPDVTCLSTNTKAHGQEESLPRHRLWGANGTSWVHQSSGELMSAARASESGDIEQE